MDQAARRSHARADLPLWKASLVNVSGLPLSPILTGQQNVSADLRDWRVSGHAPVRGKTATVDQSKTSTELSRSSRYGGLIIQATGQLRYWGMGDSE